ncbi:hypothetical protein TPHA_0P01520 [Tetrapisispora phaffii CBS 4417]|uniref:Acetylornithine aminotransferase, mitochondrial n=1 Tax=Tetrapisispora phaffii (strain ATCC 24235 / CBS 4417 / NBRC 1672 / NRRL Y-8282 / UCD 70-5) TaxID=1071381 RepID=G8C2D2_TETPH|nr:hypothetical protein TPHA_0P01520 [Tetrapisispora phaffii CBS 4417]CCE66310.1 hypothetical protein TPHA_0P01520 [Tetrapisispora phaffii CBS 4417]
MLKRCFGSQSVQSVSGVGRKAFQVTTYARADDLVISRGVNARLFDDVNGKSYIDFTAGIAVTSIGHSNAGVAGVLAEQSQRLLHSSNLYYNEECLGLSQKLVQLTRQFGGQHDASKVFFCNSGTEANEAALKFAKKYGVSQNKNKQGIVAFKNSFHGRTMGALSATYNSKYREPFGDLVPHFRFLDLNAKLTYLQDYIHQNRDSLAGLIVEPIQGEGGIFPVPTETLLGLKKICSASNVVVIYDEIQCGLGRSGKLWAHSYLPKEAHPDMFTVAKALGNGFPIAATVVNEKINNALQVGDHGTTFGGNPLGCAVSNYVLEQIANPQFLENVNKKHGLFIERLSKLKQKYPAQINEIRGKGLMIGVEFNESPAEIVKKCRERGLLVITAGKTTVRFVPALTIEDDVISEGLEIFENSVDEILAKK